MNGTTGNAMAAQSSLKTKLGGLEVSNQIDHSTILVTKSNISPLFFKGTHPLSQRRNPVFKERSVDASSRERIA